MIGLWTALAAKLRARLNRAGTGEPPLSGTPAARRQKTYSADSGYVYLYYFEGFRETPRVWEYVFTVSANRKEWFPVAVRLSRETLAGWSRDHGRELTASERFAAAKIALRRAFDAREDPATMRSGVDPDKGEMQAIAGILDLL